MPKVVKLNADKTEEKKRVAVYVRVSTNDQHIESQLQAIHRDMDRRGWKIIKIYQDKISGSKGREKRPGFDSLCTDVERGKIDVVVSWSLDRLSRSLKDLLDLSELLNERSCGLLLVNQGEIDTTTPVGKLIFTILSAIAEFERGMIRERVKTGVQRAIRQGKRWGREKVSKEVENQVISLYKQNKGMLKIAKELGIGNSTVQRIVREAKQGC